MKDSIHKYFLMGTIQWMSHPPAHYSLLDSLNILASDMFFNAIEITQIPDNEIRQGQGTACAITHEGELRGAATPARP
jgi:hypothetical protein